MLIKHKIDDFLTTIFPELKGNMDSENIIDSFKKYYTYGAFTPIVTIDNDIVNIEIDTELIIAQEADFKKVVDYCEKGKYSQAKPLLEDLILKNPTISEYHRILGQIHSDEGNQEEAINCLIDALRWDSKNGWALLMMGNIFAKFKNDINTAMKYYDQSIFANKLDHISLTNIAYLLMQQEKFEEAKKYLWEAKKINQTYPNTNFILGKIAEFENDLHSAFYSIIEAIKFSKATDELYPNAIKEAFEIAKKIIENEEGKKIVNEYRHKLEFDGGIEIDVVVDATILTAAKIEFAEYYNTPKHIVKYKPNYPAVEHLLMHELVHLDFVIKARKEDLNQIFLTTQNHKKEFLIGIEPSVKKFREMGISEDNVNKYIDGIFNGLNLQIYNTPIDIFIENFIYKEYSELRPYQFVSLYTLIQDGIKALTDSKIIELSPKNVVSNSKIYNILNAMQFKELYGIDFINQFKATPSELNRAELFYTEYNQYKDDKDPAEEYELVLHWAQDLKLDCNFELVNEKEYRTKRTDLDNLLNSIENDPYDLDSKDPYKEREMNKFIKSQERDVNTAVVMFMLDALQYFEGKPTDEIKKVAFEIATLGTQGFSPQKLDYRISTINDKLFTGFHILAYYYVSWSLSLPEAVSQLQLPYDKEYSLALKMYHFKGK